MRTIFTFIGFLVVAALVAIGIVNCNRTTTPTPPLPGTDQCANIEGVQLVIPTGMVRDANGTCTPVTGGTTAPAPGGSTNPGTGTAPVAPVAPPVVVAPPAPAPIGQCITRETLAQYVMIEKDLEENGMLAGAQGIAKVAIARGNPWWVDATHIGGVDRSLAAGTKGSTWIQAAARCPAGQPVAQSAPAQSAPAATNPVTGTQPQAAAPQGAPATTGNAQQIAAEVVKYLDPSANAVHDGKVGGYQGKIKAVPPTEVLQLVHVDKGGTRVTDPALLKIGEVVTVWVPDAYRPLPDYKTLR